MRTSVIIKSTSKFFSASCVLLMAGFTSKKVKYILRSAIQFCVLMEYMCFVDDHSNSCALVICLQISHLGLLQGPQKSSVLSGGTLALTRRSFKLFPFLKPIIGTFPKTFCVPYPLLEILDKIFLNFEKIE